MFSFLPNDSSESLDVEKLLQQASPAESFTPQAYYDPDGDCVELLLSNKPFYAERIDGLLTVYLSEEDDEIVGSQIKGLKAHLKKVLEDYPGFQIDIRAGKVCLAHLFSARLWSQGDLNPEDCRVIYYQRLRDAANKADLEPQVELTTS